MAKQEEKRDFLNDLLKFADVQSNAQNIAKKAGLSDEMSGIVGGVARAAQDEFASSLRGQVGKKAAMLAETSIYFLESQEKIQPMTSQERKALAKKIGDFVQVAWQYGPNMVDAMKVPADAWSGLADVAKQFEYVAAYEGHRGPAALKATTCHNTVVHEQVGKVIEAANLDLLKTAVNLIPKVPDMIDDVEKVRAKHGASKPAATPKTPDEDIPTLELPNLRGVAKTISKLLPTQVTGQIENLKVNAKTTAGDLIAALSEQHADGILFPTETIKGESSLVLDPKKNVLDYKGRPLSGLLLEAVQMHHAANGGDEIRYDDLTRLTNHIESFMTQMRSTTQLDPMAFAILLGEDGLIRNNTVVSAEEFKESLDKVITFQQKREKEGFVNRYADDIRLSPASFGEMFGSLPKDRAAFIASITPPAFMEAAGIRPKETERLIEANFEAVATQTQEAVLKILGAGDKELQADGFSKAAISDVKKLQQRWKPEIDRMVRDGATDDHSAYALADTISRQDASLSAILVTLVATEKTRSQTEGTDELISQSPMAETNRSRLEKVSDYVPTRPMVNAQVEEADAGVLAQIAGRLGAEVATQSAAR